MSLAFEIAVVFVLLAINGWFAMSELAVVSSRRARLEAMAREGNRGAARALKLASDPGRFLSAVQIGITLVGVLAGAYSGATLASPLAETLLEAGVDARFAGPLSIAIVVGGITYLSLIVGELVPKRIALTNPERVASVVAGSMTVVSRLASPLITVLDASSRLVLALLRLDTDRGETVTEEEIRAVIAEGTRSGILEPQEKELMSGVMRFSDRSIRGIMTPRRDIVAIDADEEHEVLVAVLTGAAHSRYPVYEGTIDAVIGIVQAKDLLDDLLEGRKLDVRAAMKPVQVVPETAPALTVINLLSQSDTPMAVVMDEYGSVEGIVTAADILEVIVGTTGEGTDDAGAAMIRRDDGSWLIDADLPVDLVADRLDCPELDDPDRDYETLAGFLLWVSKSIPVTGEILEWRGWRFEIVDMDGRRIDKVLAVPPADPEVDEATPA